MHRQRIRHEEDAMHVVGHHLHSHHLYLRIKPMNAHPLALHRLPQFRQFDARLVTTARFCIGIPHNATEERAPSFHFQRNHIHTPLPIVVMAITAFHRSLFLSGVFLLRIPLLVSHLCFVFDFDIALIFL